MNVVVITGNLTRDPELRSTGSGTSVCKLRVAVNTRRKDASGDWVDKPNYFDVTVWGAQGENCATYLSKGRPVAVEGRLDWREWEAKDGSASARRSRSSPTRSSSSAAATAAASGNGGALPGPVRRPRRHLGLRLAPSPRPSAPRTTTSRSRPGGDSRRGRFVLLASAGCAS